MLTALISAVTGLVSGAAPKIIKEVTATREHKRELEMLERQTQMQLEIAKVNGNTKIAEMDRELEIKAYDTQGRIAVQSLEPIGIAWVDAWNSALRPFASTVIILLFTGMTCFYSYAVISEVNTLAEGKLAVELLWGSLVGEAVQAVLGFIFGYRSTIKK